MKSHGFASYFEKVPFEKNFFTKQTTQTIRIFKGRVMSEADLQAHTNMDTKDETDRLDQYDLTNDPSWINEFKPTKPVVVINEEKFVPGTPPRTPTDVMSIIDDCNLAFGELVDSIVLKQAVGFRRLFRSPPKLTDKPPPDVVRPKAARKLFADDDRVVKRKKSEWRHYQTRLRNDVQPEQYPSTDGKL